MEIFVDQTRIFSGGKIEMKFEEFMSMYDNWNSIMCVNDDNLELIVKDEAVTIMETRKDLFEKKVVAFGFYDGEFCVRVE